MAEPHHLSRAEQKARLIAEIARSRTGMESSFRDTRENLDSVRSAASHKGLWLTGAVAGGWLLAKLTGRKAPQKSRSSRKSSRSNSLPAAQPLQNLERSGWLLALLGTLGTLLRPAITSYLTHRLNDYLTRAGGLGGDHHTASSRDSFPTYRR